jgi:hypothetical protein
LAALDAALISSEHYQMKLLASICRIPGEALECDYGCCHVKALQKPDFTLATFAFLVGDLQLFYFLHHTPWNKEHIVCALVGRAGLD